MPFYLHIGSISTAAYIKKRVKDVAQGDNGSVPFRNKASNLWLQWWFLIQSHSNRYLNPGNQLDLNSWALRLKVWSSTDWDIQALYAAQYRCTWVHAAQYTAQVHKYGRWRPTEWRRQALCGYNMSTRKSVLRQSQSRAVCTETPHPPPINNALADTLVIWQSFYSISVWNTDVQLHSEQYRISQWNIALVHSILRSQILHTSFKNRVHCSIVVTTTKWLTLQTPI